MKQMKQVIKYILIFIATVFLLTGVLILTAKIPKEAIAENIKESAGAFHTENEIDRVINKREYTYTHPYSDAMVLNIIYCIDTDNPVASVMEANYHLDKDQQYINYDFENLVQQEGEGNTEYIRYWHGSMSVLRPLLVFFNLDEIYILNKILVAVLTLILIILLAKTKIKELLITFIIGIVMCAVITIPNCLMYTWTYLIMLIVSIIAIFLEKKNKNTNILYFISGIITCYFDFLCTELLSIVVPIVLILVIRYKNGKIKNFKEGLKYIVISLALWGIGYVGMWAAKWILASIILKINALDYVVDKAMIRVNKDERLDGEKNIYMQAIWKNIHALYPINIVKRVYKLLIIPVFIVEYIVIFIKKQNKKEFWFPLLLLIFATIPYIRYIILVSHSYAHYFFTFRMQMASIMCILLAIYYSTDINKYDLKIKKKKK